MVWMEFIARMGLAGIILLPAGGALLWAARHWSQTRTSVLHRRMFSGTSGSVHS
jgi:hypothetical protein